MRAHRKRGNLETWKKRNRSSSAEKSRNENETTFLYAIAIPRRFIFHHTFNDEKYVCYFIMEEIPGGFCL